MIAVSTFSDDGGFVTTFYVNADDNQEALANLIECGYVANGRETFYVVSS